jgi:cell division protein FtsI/penicillin-binding protein 2
MARIKISCLFFMCLLAAGPVRTENMETALEILARSYGEFAFVITNPKTGIPLFIYNNEFILKRGLCPGSLLKPFALVASSRSYSLKPEKQIDCKGRTSGEISCWLHEGHGKINLIQALAYSCHYYFYFYIKDHLHKTDFNTVLQEFGLPPFNGIDNLSPQEFYQAAIGLNSRYTVTPLEMIYAYNALFNGGFVRNRAGEQTGRVFITDDVRETLFQGLRECALYGTGKKIYKEFGNIDLIIKTGTGASVRNGVEIWYQKVRWVIILSPGVDPTFSMLVVMEKKEMEDIHDLTIELLYLLKMM